MNGFNKILIIGLIFFVSCYQNIKQKDGEALFLIYRGIPQNLKQKIMLWNSPQEFLEKEKSNMNQSAQDMIASLDPRLFVLRIGQIKNQIPYKIKKIEYVSDGETLHIFLENIDQNILMDLGYPIFILNRQIHHIKLFTNNIRYTMTNK